MVAPLIFADAGPEIDAKAVPLEFRRQVERIVVFTVVCNNAVEAAFQVQIFNSTGTFDHITKKTIVIAAGYRQQGAEAGEDNRINDGGQFHE